MIPLRTLIVSALSTLGLEWHVVRANSPSVVGENVTVLREDIKLLNGSSAQKTFHGGTCRMGLSSKGRLFVERKVFVDGNDEYREAWSSKSSKLGSGTYYTKINQDDGSLVIYKTKSGNGVVSWRTPVYAIHSYYNDPGDVTKPFRLKIDEACVLRLVGKFENQGSIVDAEVWSSNRLHIKKLDILQKGDILSGYIPYLCSDGFSGRVYCLHEVSSHLSLQSDCNVVQKFGFDGSYFEESDTVWDSNSGENGDPDCYIFNTVDFVGVFKGKWDDYDRETLYPVRKGLIWRTPKTDQWGTVQDNWSDAELLGDRGFFPD